MSGVKSGPYQPLQLPQADRNQMVDWSIPAQTDEQGRSYQTTYGGQRFYVNDGSQGVPTNTFAHSYAWDPATGTYKASLNSGGILGAVEGAGALAAPAIIGPAVAGALGGGATGAAGSTAGGVLPSTSLASTAGMTSAAPAVTAGAVGGHVGLLGTVANLLGIGRGNTANIIGAAGSALGSAANASAQNRSSKVDAALAQQQLQEQQQRDYQQAAAQQEALRQQGLASSFRTAQQAAYLQNRKPYTPPRVLGGYTLPTFGLGNVEQPTSQSVKDAATAAAADAMQALYGGGTSLAAPSQPTPFQIDPSLMDPSPFEKFANLASPVMTGLSTLSNSSTDPLAELDPQSKALVEAAIGKLRTGRR